MLSRDVTETANAGVVGHSLLAPKRAAASVPWSKPADIPLDRDGPIAIPYEPPVANFVERPIYALFETAAARNPGAFALVDTASKLTYADLRENARRLANVIAAEVELGKAVAVLLPNNSASVTAVLACLAAGRCCVVLNGDHPAGRNGAILRDAGVGAVIVADENAAALVPDGIMCIASSARIDGDHGATVRPLAPLGPDDPAIVLYTSGSTGQPKGIVLSQRTILSRVRNNIVAMHLNDRDRFLSLGALGTTAGMVASLVALLCGTMQFVISVSAAGAGNLLTLARDEGVTILWGVPALLRMLFGGSDAATALTSLRVVRTFGEPLLKADLVAWYAVLPESCHLAVTYGQTEVTAAQWFVPRDFAGEERIVPAGYLLPEHDFAIVDEDGRSVPPGEIGELVLRSRCVALGEWQQGRCIAARTRPDPADPRRRLLATGDLVRLREDSLLQIIGRRDRQVKINGQRVEPAEIEDVLRRVRGVADAAIAARRDAEQPELLAFLVALDPADESLKDRVRIALRQALPPCMQPSRILSIDTLPRLPGGKVDEKALLSLAVRTPPGPETDQPRGASATARAQRAVAKAWLRVLDRAALAADQPFDESGGDSLRLLKFVFHIEEQCKVTLPLDAFYGSLRPSDFAHRLDRCLDAEPAAAPESPPLFFFPGMGRHEPHIVRFRKTCEPSVRVEPVEYGDWPDWVAPGFDFETLLARLVASIEARAPEGPLLLAGYSIGGHFVYAAAQALRAAGRAVSFVGILDTTLSRARAPRAAVSSRPATRRGEVRELATAFRQGHAADALARFLIRRLISPRWAPVLRLVARFRHVRLPGDFGFYLHSQLRMTLLTGLVTAWHRGTTTPTKRLPARVVLFRAEGHPVNVPDDHGWRAFCADLTIVPVSGDHRTMFDSPHLATLGRRFVDWVRQSRVTIRD